MYWLNCTENQNFIRDFHEKNMGTILIANQIYQNIYGKIKK